MMAVLQDDIVCEGLAELKAWIYWPAAGYTLRLHPMKEKPPKFMHNLRLRAGERDARKKTTGSCAYS
jgi:hypothetical protein